MIAVIDIETTGLNRYKDNITWVGIALFEQESMRYKPYRVYTLDPNQFDQRNKLLKLLNKLVKKKIKCVWQNGKFDTLWIEHHLGFKLPISYDVMLMGTAYDLTAKHGLKPMAQKYLGVEDWDIDKKTKLSGDADAVVPYLKLDLKYTYLLYVYFKKRLDKTQKRLYNKLLMPAYRLYRKIEREGIYFNLPRYYEVKQEYAEKEEEILNKLNSYYEINWNSSQQKADVLFNKEGMPIIKQTPKGQPSSDKSVLKRLANKGYEIPQLILDYSAVNTLNKMFLARWGDDAVDSRLHPSFNITNVVSGRTSSSGPNLQQCYDKETEVLTLTGFKLFKDLKKDEKVAQWNFDGSIEFVTPIRYIKQKYTGNMISLVNQHIDLLVTPNHRCLLQHRKTGKYKTILANNFQEDYRHLHGGLYKEGKLSLPWEMIALICATQADGMIDLVKKIRFIFTKDRKVSRLEKALNLLGLNYTKKPCKVNQIEIRTDKSALPLLKNFIDENKCFTYNLLNLDEESRRLFLEEIRYWDGLSTRKNTEYTSVKRKNADIVQCLYTLNNTRSLLSIDNLNYVKSNGVQSIAYRVYETKGRNYSLTTNINKNLIDYDDFIYCVEVPSSYIIIRRNGKTSVSGNCPNESSLRNLFTAPKGRLFFEADYSQLELRIAAHYAEEPTMIDIYANHGDIHTETARLFTHGEPTKQDRKKAKSVNFGFIYEMQAKTFKDYAYDSYGVEFTMEEAEDIRTAFFRKYSQLPVWYHIQEMKCERDGGVYNLFGRFRALPDIYEQDKFKRMAAIRRAINTPVQGTGSDILLSAAIQVEKELSPYGLKIVGTVHDSILGEFNAKDEKWIVPEIRRIMENPELLKTFGIKLKVGLEVDIGVGPWGSK